MSRGGAGRSGTNARRGKPSGERRPPAPPGEETPQAVIVAILRQHSRSLTDMQPATGNQLWRLNVLGILGNLFAAKLKDADEDEVIHVENGDIDGSLYVSQGEASQLLQWAKDKGMW